MVNTFVISSDLKECAKALDKVRLNRQCQEARVIIDNLKNKGKKCTHPAEKMWYGHVPALKLYYNVFLRQWIKKGGMTSFDYYEIDDDEDIEFPWWFEWDIFHTIHKYSLMRKMPSYYHFDDIPDEYTIFKDLGYLWPSDLDKSTIRKICNDRLSIKEIASLCRPIGTGAPAQYRWTKEEVDIWVKDKTHNPKTGRQISSTSKTGIYADLTKAYNHYYS